MADIRVKDLTEATVPGADYYLLTDSATDGVKKVKTTNVVTPADIGAASLTGAETLTNKTLTAPAIGDATATTVNKIAITTPATGATLTIADGKTLTVSADATVSGTNTGDQTITLTGDVTGSGTGSFVATIGATKVTSAMLNADVFSTAHTWSGVQTFTNPVVGTQTAGDNSTKAASTAFVQAALTGSTAGVSSLNGQTGALTLAVTPQGRLTLASGTAVMSASQSAATTIYYTPAVGNMVPIYDGTNMVPTVFAELSQLTTDATKSPAAVAASSIYDLFVWNDGGTIRCTRGPAWTNATTRGYTFTVVNGIALNTSAITNGPAASRGTWVGTIASNASSTIDYIFGTSGNGGVAGRLMVWNAYNRVNVGTNVVDTTSFTDTSATIKQFHSGGTGMQVEFVVGSQIDAVRWDIATEVVLAAVSGAFAIIGIGYDTITAFSGQRARIANPTAVTFPFGLNQSGVLTPAVGTHKVAMLQQSDSSNANQFNNVMAASLSVSLWA